MGAHLILVGIPGAGKSTIGRALAERWQRPFVDLDEQIEVRAGMTVREIFAVHGEPRFREMERDATEQLTREARALIVAPGGGWIAVPGLVELVRPPAQLVWLRVSAERALARLGDQVNSRPLLAGSDPLAALTAILAAREAFYLQADHTVSVDMMTPDDAVDAIVALARHWRTD
jgi:shikimate kinase